MIISFHWLLRLKCFLAGHIWKRRGNYRTCQRCSRCEWLNGNLQWRRVP